MNKLLQLLKKYREIVSYLFWGVMSTIVSWGSYGLFVVWFAGMTDEMHLFGWNIPMVVVIANVLSWICAITFAFFTNKLWVFESKSWNCEVWLPELGKFLSSRIATGVVEMVGVPLLVGIGLNQTIYGIEGMLAKVIVSVVVVLLNYVFSKLFVFKE